MNTYIHFLKVKLNRSLNFIAIAILSRDDLWAMPTGTKTIKLNVLENSIIRRLNKSYNEISEAN